MKIKIALVAPSWDSREEDIASSKKLLTEFFTRRGYELEFKEFLPDSKFYDRDEAFRNAPAGCRDPYRELQAIHFSARAAKIKEALESDCQIIWAVKGGTGGVDMIVENLTKMPIAVSSPKMLFGYSDVTALHNFCIAMQPLVTCVQTPCFEDFKHERSPEVYSKFLGELTKIFSGADRISYPLITLTPGATEAESGKSIGGSALMFIDSGHAKMCRAGTFPWRENDIDQKILFLESSNYEKVVKRMNEDPSFFASEKARVKAVVLANFSNKTPEELEREIQPFCAWMRERGIPIHHLSKEYNFGHDAGRNFVPIVLGNVRTKAGEIIMELPREIFRPGDQVAAASAAAVSRPQSQVHLKFT